jgi:hypothetical protein
MPDRDEVAVKPQLMRAPIRLGKPSRWSAFVLGLAGLGAGSVAVFVTHLEAGPVALLLVGLVLALIGLGGVLPTRIKIGENEAEFQHVIGDALQTLVETARPESKEEVAEVIDRVAEVAPDTASSALSTIAYERLVERMLSRVASDIRDDIPGARFRYQGGLFTRLRKSEELLQLRWLWRMLSAACDSRYA